MNILEIDWQHFLDDLPAFQSLPCEARRLFLELEPVLGIWPSLSNLHDSQGLGKGLKVRKC